MGIFDIFNPDTASIAAAGKDQQEAIETGARRAQDVITKSEEQARGDIGGALQPFQETLVPQSLDAFNLFSDLVTGGDAARDALGVFREGLGYQDQLAQGEQALSRLANSQGQLLGPLGFSGGLTGDVLDFSQQLANKTFMDFSGLLGGFAGQAPGIASQQGGLFGQLANIAQTSGQNRANIVNQAFQQMGASEAQTAANIFSADQAASANAMNLFTDLLGLAVGAAGAGIIPGITPSFNIAGGSSFAPIPSFTTTVTPG